ncbi:MAG: hypothetical protein ABR936_04425 [Bacteroidota bacterium]
MKKTTYLTIRRFSFLVILFLLATAMLTAQNKVVIKERVEISPTNSVKSQTMQNSGFPNITIGPIEPRFTDLSADCGISCDDPNADIPFVPRIGGTMGIALYPCSSASGDTYNDILLVFGPDGNIRNMFPLSDLDSVFVLSSGTHYFWDPCYEHLVPVNVDAGGLVKLWNPFTFSQAGYNMAIELYGHADSADYWYAPYRITVPVKAWEPLRFRLLTKNGSLIKDINCYQGIGSDSNSFVISGNWTDFPSSWPPYDGGGVLVFRSGDYNANLHYDPATVFPMVWLDIDSSAIGGAPTGVPYSGPITLPDSGFYQIILTGANPNVTGTLTYIDTASHIFVSDIQGSIGDTIHVGPYSAGTQLQVQLNGINPFTSQADYATWNMGFENWIDFGEPDVTVNIEYGAGPPDHLELWSTSSTVYYGDTVDVDVVPCGSDSLFSPVGVDENYAFSVSLEGETSRYGQLIYNGVGGDYFDGIPSVGRRGVGVKFAANGIEPDSSVDLKFFLASYYIGPVYEGPPTSIKTPPIKQTKTKILMKKSNNNPRMGDVISKNNTVALNRDSQNKIYNNAKLKKLQAISAIMQPKKKKIGHPLAAGRNNTLTPKSHSQKSMSIKTSVSSVQMLKSGYLGNYWTMGEKEYTILLGETQYYQVQTDDNDFPIFLKLEVGTDGKPICVGSSITAQFGAYGIIKDHTSIYWENKWSNPATLNGYILDKDIVRVVGRYWEAGQEGKGNNSWLYADISGKGSRIQIEVKKPTKLGKTYTYSRSVYDSPDGDPRLNIDEKCFEYGGKYGIPPQFIKAQIFNEASKNLDGIKGKGFAPTYVYEPYTAQFGNWKDYHYAKGLWLVTKTSMGTGKRVPDHLNVQDFPYPTTPLTVWDMIVEHSQLVNATSGFDHTKYGKRKDDGSNEMDFKPYTDINNIYKEQLRAALYSCYFFGAPQGQTYADVSREYMARYLRDDCHEVGAINITAQTRVASSYGFLQMCFTTAVEDKDRGYPYNDSNKSPEDLNETDINFFYGIN